MDAFLRAVSGIFGSTNKPPQIKVKRFVYQEICNHEIKEKNYFNQTWRCTKECIKGLTDEFSAMMVKTVWIGVDELDREEVKRLIDSGDLTGWTIEQLDKWITGVVK